MQKTWAVLEWDVMSSKISISLIEMISGLNSRRSKAESPMLSIVRVRVLDLGDFMLPIRKIVFANLNHL